MRIERLNDDAGYVGISLRLQPSDIDVLIERLRELRSDPTQHFHLSTVPLREDDAYVDVEVSSQSDDETSNAAQSGFAIPPEDGTGR